MGTVAVGCVRLLFRTASREEVGGDIPVQIGFAPGRGARKAVERNRIKRILREVYRVHQSPLVDLFSQRGDTLLVMVLFRGQAEAASTCIPHDLSRALQQVAGRFAPHE